MEGVTEELAASMEGEGERDWKEAATLQSDREREWANWLWTLCESGLRSKGMMTTTLTLTDCAVAL